MITYDFRSSNALYYYAGMLESIIFIDVLVCFLIYMFIQQIHLNLCTSTGITKVRGVHKHLKIGFNLYEADFKLNIFFQDCLEMTKNLALVKFSGPSLFFVILAV